MITAKAPITAALAAMAFPLFAHANMPRKNILVIVADDLGAMDLGCYNPGTFYETPNLDKLAAQSVRFTNGYAACPVCSPSRFGLMTGRYATRVNATDFFGGGKRSATFAPAKMIHRMPLEEITLAEKLREAGYQTAFVGKWHLGGDESLWPEHQGFEKNIAGWSQGRPSSYFSPYKNPRLPDGPPGEYITDRLAAETIELLRNRDKARPFLVIHSFYQVHTPLQAPLALVEKYKTKAKKAGLAGGEAEDFGNEEQAWPGEPPRRVRVRQSHVVYAAMMESMDKAVGRILDELDRQGLAENTLVVFISDNGGLSTSEGHPTSNLPHRGGKGWLYEGGLRVPFIIRLPGAAHRGRVCDTPVSGIDLFPTALAIAGAALPADREIDGTSLLPLLEKNEPPARDALYWHYPHYSNQGGFPGSAIRTGDWKLIERLENGQLHLYNLANDIGETRDLIKQEPVRAAMMRAKLHAWYEKTGARFLEQKSGGPRPWRPDTINKQEN